METKRCSRCGEVKDVGEFYYSKASKDHCFCRCKKCDKEYKKEYFKLHPEKLKERNRKYRKYKPVSELTQEELAKERKRDRIRYARRHNTTIEELDKKKEEVMLKRDAEIQRKEAYKEMHRNRMIVNAFLYVLKKIRYIFVVIERYEENKRKEKRKYQRLYKRRYRKEKNKDKIELHRKEKAREYYQLHRKEKLLYGREYYQNGAGREKGRLMRERIDDCYIRGQLVASGFPKDGITQDLIDFKRVYLQLKREIKKQ